MSEPIHVLVVRAAGLSWALPMGSVEQNFAFGAQRVHDVAGSRVVVFRGDALEVVALAERPSPRPSATSPTAPSRRSTRPRRWRR